jgi:hypothetical protein
MHWALILLFLAEIDLCFIVTEVLKSRLHLVQQKLHMCRTLNSNIDFGFNCCILMIWVDIIIYQEFNTVD